MSCRSVRGAMRRHLAGLAVTTACCLGGCATNEPTLTIPFTLTAAGNVSIRAVLNGRDQLDLMFHTAVDSVSLTEAAIAKLMTFTSDGSIVVNSWGGSNQARHSSGNSLRIGALEWHDLELTESEHSGPGTDGKFGPNLFAGRVLELDFDAGELRLHTRLPPYATSWQRIELLQDHSSMRVEGELSVGALRARTGFLLHTGYAGNALLDEQFVHDHGLDSELVAAGDTELRDSYGNPVRTRRVRLRGLQFGSIAFADVPAAIFDGKLGAQRTSVLGAGMLTRMNLIFDAERRYLYARPNRRAAAPW